MESALKPNTIETRPFGQTSTGAAARLFVLELPNGVRALISNLGGVITELRVPDRDGRLGDVVLGFDDLAGYQAARRAYLGCLVGRYAGRIGAARFSLDGREYRLPPNEGVKQLHGGPEGFDQALWSATSEVTPEGPRLTLEHTSPDGDQGYPGRLKARVTYTLRAPAELRVDYSATTDAPTVLNLTQHSYFNLRGEGDILDHTLQIDASRFAVTDDSLIPTGELRAVAGTPFDLRSPVALRAALAGQHAQLALCSGFDHSFVLDAPKDGLRRAARLVDPHSGRTLEVLTTEPTVLLYTANFLKAEGGKGGRALGPRAGLCLETQHLPDSPNRPEFPSTVLRPGETFKSTTVFRFGVESR